MRQIGGHLTYQRLAGLASPSKLACVKAKMNKQGTYTRRIDNVVETELSDERVELEQEGEGLTDTTYERVKVSNMFWSGKLHVTADAGDAVLGKEGWMLTGSTANDSLDHVG